MNILIKKLIDSKRVQDTAGIVRGAFRILQADLTNNSKPLPDLDNLISKNIQSKGSSEINGSQEKISDKMQNFTNKEPKSEETIQNNDEKSVKEPTANEPKTIKQNFSIDSDNFINTDKEGESGGMKIYTDPKSIIFL